ncbi:hypothetical protein RND71_044073 [Anisodus tanguticus]|uniref:Dynein light intermediate chain n=1 Tax=Anisodus tanguticus TaxID=243964 RepID=A0AAE1QRL1_9SOLA|nr:hypothetical protein RND71_044073 [Anisodus tanguticus]
MANPWDIMDSLEQWSKVLENHVKNLNMDPNKLNGYKKQLSKRYQEYISPGDEIEGLVSSQIKSRKLDSEDIEEEEILEGDVLINNLGLDIVVVITKTDYMSNLEKEYDYKEESFDFIQQAIHIKAIIKTLSDLATSTNPNSRKGGVIGLASVAVALGPDLEEEYIEQTIRPMFASLDDQDSQVR